MKKTVLNFGLISAVIISLLMAAVMTTQIKRPGHKPRPLEGRMG